MQSHIFRWASALVLALSLCTGVQAAQLSVAPGSQDILIGSSVDAQLVISDFRAGGAPALGAFDIDFAFDPFVLSFTGFTFGDSLLGNQLDLFGLGSITSTTPGTASVNLFQLSLDSIGDLDSLQASSFALGTIRFNTVGIGSSSLTINPISLSDSAGTSLTATTLSGTVSVHAVPEPDSAALLIAGIAVMAAITKRRRPS